MIWFVQNPPFLDASKSENYIKISTEGILEAQDKQLEEEEEVLFWSQKDVVICYMPFTGSNACTIQEDL